MEQPDFVETTPRDKEVEGFIRDVWYHPLVTSETVRLRQDLRNRVTGHFRSIGISPNDYIAIPHGSIVGFVNQESDIDLFSIMTGEATTKYYQSAHCYIGAPPLPGDDVQIGNYTSRDHFMRLIEEGDINADNASMILGLLITPDVLVIGNQAMLHVTRLSLVKMLRRKLKERPEKTADSLKYIGDIFRSHYSGWPEYPQGPGGNRIEQREKRKERYAKILAEYTKKRAMESPVGRKTEMAERIEATIEKSRRGMELVDLNTLFAYLEAHGGCLDVRSN